MVSKTNEQALESAIEKYLTGTCREESSDGVADIFDGEKRRGCLSKYAYEATDCRIAGSK